jgi:hypothetical protein
MDDNYNFQPEYSSRKLLGGYSYSNAPTIFCETLANFYNQLDEIGSRAFCRFIKYHKRTPRLLRVSL